MNFRISISQRAKRDIREITAWIKERSSKGALSWLDALEESLEQLQKVAASSGAAPEADDFDVNLRQHLFRTRRGNTYRLVFILRDDVVQVLAVRGTGQDFLQQSDIEFSD